VTSPDALSGAVAEFSRGNLEEAQRLCERVLARDGADPQALQLAAAIALRMGRVEAALARADAAVQHAPTLATAYQTRGQVLRQQRRNAEAERDFLRACELDPGFADAHASLGALRVAMGEHGEARPYLEKAVAARPAAAEWRYNLALCDMAGERWEEAGRHLEEVLKRRPQWAEALNARGAVLMHLGRTPEAETTFESAVLAAPDRPQGWSNLGLAQLALGRTQRAVASLERCVALAPADAKGWTHLGNALRARGDREGAERAYRKGLEQGPAEPAVRQNLGNLLREAGRLDEAIATLESGLAKSPTPELHFSLAIALLAAGRNERGWDEYGWRMGTMPAPLEPARKALESGGLVELQGEQGLGDMLFFLRWTAAAPAGARFAWRGDARLAPLLQGTSISAAPAPGTASMHAGDLPRLFAGTSHPAPLGIHVSEQAREAALKALRESGPAPYLGVAWRAGLPFNAAEERLVKELPLERFAEALARWPGTLVSLQRNPRAGDIDVLRARSARPVHDAGDYNDDLARLAGLVAALDLYAGVSSTNVHIGAGVGLAAHILVPFPAEWRYAGAGGESPWFPGYALHREDPRGGWDAALEGLAQALERWNGKR